MAKKAYVGVSGTPKNVKAIYVGVNGVPKKVIKGYVGVNGVPCVFWDGGEGLNVGVNVRIKPYDPKMNVGVHVVLRNH